MTFRRWFRLQFGALPLPQGAYDKLKRDLEAAELKVTVAIAALQRADQLSAQYKAAQYAWQVKAEDKEEP